MATQESIPVQQSSVAELTPRAARSVTTLRLGRLLCGANCDSPCRIRNISANGMMIETNRTLPAGLEITVQLRCGSQLVGSVVWSDGNRAGIEFPHPIDLEHFLARATHEHGANDCGIPRAPRFVLGYPAKLGCFGRMIPVFIANVSQSGLRVRSTQPLRVGQDLMLHAPGLPQYGCTVRWADGEEAGLAFQGILPFDDLSNWLATRHQCLPE